MTFSSLSASGAGCVGLFLIVTLLIGWLSRQRGKSSNAFLLSSRSLPLPVVATAYIAANCGALEIIGMSAMAAQYGIRALHFYWLGAIPAMICLSIWMMPVYRRSGIKTIPAYLEARYGPSVRLVNACVTATMTLLLGGVSLYAIGQILEVVIHANFTASIFIAAGVVLIYVLLGGIRATIYNEVFQLVVILAGLIPLAIRCIRLSLSEPASLQTVKMHLWQNLPLASTKSQFDLLGLIFGLGFILSFGYWCTDFVLMQRAFAARTDLEARQVPLIAGFGKLLFSALVIVPGLIAARTFPDLGHSLRFDQALPTLMKAAYGPTMLGVGLTALGSSLMTGLAGNVAAFSTLWTEDIYRTHLIKDASDRHYILVGRLAVAFAILSCIVASYLNFLFGNLMEHVQMIFSIFGSPFFAIFVLGFCTRRTTARGALVGLGTGLGIGLLHLLGVAVGVLHYGSVMNANFHLAIYTFSSTLLVGWISSTPGDQAQPQLKSELLLNWKTYPGTGRERSIWILAVLLLGICLLLNILWR